ncbi:DNA internalization-related competence protein ComEC/Rec2 [Dendrosporobacter sp. 1207_IL3150]|uniref:DNA internalization-related competence protein ComEC/Rec2 n=1 Tax=Dendrosporobacter sp. 1207_IL3150 TaxID=3084054 RepID=UPI002FD9F70E
MDNVKFINSLVVTVVIGILIASKYTFSINVLSFLVFLAAICTSWAIYRKYKAAQLLIILLFLIMGVLRFTHDQVPSPYEVGRYVGHEVTVYGRIDESPQIYFAGDKIRTRYVVSSEKILDGEKGTAFCVGKIVVNSSHDIKKPTGTIGDKIRVTGELQALHGFNNPGILDSVASLKRAGVSGRITTSSGQIDILTDDKSDWQEKIAMLREKVILFMKQVMPHEDAAILFGILFGGYKDISQEVISAFSTTGIVHILSVSGTHIALVASVILWLCNRIKLNGKFAALIVFLAILIYAALAGFTPPVVRSAVMGILALGAVALGREKDSYQALALVSLVMILFKPELIFDISFQLSFGATGGLIYLFPKIYSRMSSLPQWLAGPFALTAAAQLGVIPFIAWYFNALSLSAFIANLTIVPIIELIVILGLAGLLAGNISVTIGKIALVICSLAIGLVLKLVKLLAAIPGGSIYLPSFNILAGVFYYVFLAYLFGYIPAKSLGLVSLFRRWTLEGIILITAICLSALLYLNYPRPASVHFIDVAQGDATLVKTPHGRAILIDTGGLAGQSSFDIGEKVVLPYLRHYGVQTLDYLILTHGHQDHAGGAEAIAKKISIKNILLAREGYSVSIQKLLKNSSGYTVIPAYTGQNIILDGVFIEVIYAADSQSKTVNNEASNVIRITYGQHSFLITGDLEVSGESVILDSGSHIKSTVLKVGHHGAKTSTSPEFLHAVLPQYAVISVGANNRYGHPNKEVLQLLKDHEIEVYRTDKNGAIVFETDGKILSVDNYLND